MIARLDRDAADLAAALDWLLAQGRRVEVADMCWSLWLYHWLRVVAAGLGDEQRARRFGADALRLAGERHDRWAAAIALTGLCWLNAAVDRFADEEATFEDMMAAARWSQDPL